MDLGWESIQSRRNTRTLLLSYKILHGIAPNNLSELLPPLVQETTTFNLRNSDNIRNYPAHKPFSQLFFPFNNTCMEWNFKRVEICTLCGFFQTCSQAKCKGTPNYYNVGTRKRTDVSYSRLRLECSSLNADLYRKNIVNSPSCQCGYFESHAHFLLHCPILMNETKFSTLQS